MRDHGQSLDYVFMGDAGGMICHGAARSPRAAMLHAATGPDAALLQLQAEFKQAEKLWLDAEDADDPAYKAVDEIADRIVAMPAVTLAGVMAKVGLGAWFEDGDEEGMAAMLKSVTRDLEGMNKEART